MATRRISILTGMVKPDNVGNVYQEPYDIKATNDNWQPLVWIFADSALRDALHGAVEIPLNYAGTGTAQIIIVWTAVVTTGNVVWDIDYRAVGGNDTESLDQATAQESLTVTDAAPAATVNNRLEALMTITTANIAAGDTLLFKVCRDGTDGADTMASSAILVDVLLSYEDA